MCLNVCWFIIPLKCSASRLKSFKSSNQGTTCWEEHNTRFKPFIQKTFIFGLFYVLCCSLASAINWAGGQNKKSNHCIHHCSSNVSLFLLNQRNSSCLKVSFEDAFLKKRGLSLGAESDLNADNQIFGQLVLCILYL